VDRGGIIAKTQKFVKLYEEQCLKATLGTSAKAQSNKHLSAGGYKMGGGAGNNMSNATNNGQKAVAMKWSQPQSAQKDKALGQQPIKPALKAEGSSLKKIKKKDKPTARRPTSTQRLMKVNGGVGRRAFPSCGETCSSPVQASLLQDCLGHVDPRNRGGVVVLELVALGQCCLEPDRGVGNCLPFVNYKLIQ
jgi:hypothetical protein